MNVSDEMDFQDQEARLQLLLKRAEEGDPSAQKSLGALYYFGDGVPENLEEAQKWFKRALQGFLRLAEAGDTTGQVMAGFLLEHGFGVEENLAEAARWYQQAADLQNPDGEASLAELLYYGRGVPRDVLAAAQLWRQAAERGHTSAQLFLALVLHDGKGVPADLVEATMWLRIHLAGSPSEERLELLQTWERALDPGSVILAKTRALEWLKANPLP